MIRISAVFLVTKSYHSRQFHPNSLKTFWVILLFTDGHFWSNSSVIHFSTGTICQFQLQTRLDCTARPLGKLRRHLCSPTQITRRRQLSNADATSNNA